MNVDITELLRLEHDLDDVVPVIRAVRQVVSHAGYNVKMDAIGFAEASSGKHARHYPRTISYDLRADGTAIEAEIGPSGAGQAELAPVLEYGSPTSPPHRDLGRAADLEEPRFIDALAEIEVLPP